ncbi:MAG: metallopeptidase family protein [Devosia sp.]
MSDIDTFTAIAQKVYRELPQEFRRLTQDIELRIEDVPDEETCQMMKLGHPYDLLGLFQGVGLRDAPAAEYTGLMPNKIWLFRLPIIAFQADGEDSLEDVIRHVLIHEIGHHFGLSDDDMYAIDDEDEGQPTTH